MEKTASFADTFSLDDRNETYVGVTQDYGMRSFAYLPSSCFKAYATQEHKFKEKFAYPKTFRGIYTEKKKNNEVLDSLLDLKNKKTKYLGKNANEIA